MLWPRPVDLRGVWCQMGRIRRDARPGSAALGGLSHFKTGEEKWIIRSYRMSVPTDCRNKYLFEPDISVLPTDSTAFILGTQIWKIWGSVFRFHDGSNPIKRMILWYFRIASNRPRLLLYSLHERDLWLALGIESAAMTKKCIRRLYLPVMMQIAYQQKSSEILVSVSHQRRSRAYTICAYYASLRINKYLQHISTLSKLPRSRAEKHEQGYHRTEINRIDSLWFTRK